jgi:hypothetical protein
MTRLIALGTLSLVVALSLVVVPLASAQVLDNDNTLGQNVTESPSPSPTVSPTTSPTTSPTGTTSPGLPDTGIGGNAAMNFGILLASGLIVLGGVALLSRRTV